MIINGEVYFDEAKNLAEENGQLVYDISDGSWSYTYFSIEYPIFNTIEDVKGKIDKLADKLSEENETSSDSSETASEQDGDTSDTSETESEAEDTEPVTEE